MSQFAQDIAYQATASACVVDVTAPTGGAINSLVANSDGSLTVGWPSASDPSGPILYDVFIQAATNVGLFNSTNRVGRFAGNSRTIHRDANNVLLARNQTWHAGVRAVDALGNVNGNTTSLSVLLTAPNYAAISSQVWDELKTDHTIADSFGDYLDVEVSSRALSSDLAVLLSRLTATRANFLDNLTNLDAEISSVLTAIGAIPAAPSAGAIADAVWDAPLADHLGPGTTGQRLSQTCTFGQGVEITGAVTSGELQTSVEISEIIGEVENIILNS